MKNLIKKNTTISVAIIILSLHIFFTCGAKDNQTAGNKNKGNNHTDSLVIELGGFTGKSVFELTREKHKVDFVESSMGIFVKGIDSVPSSRNFAWIFSVNDSFVPIGSNDYITDDTDVIKWHYRKF